jgi:hypothetical protein
MDSRQVYWLSAVLIAMGLGLFLYKAIVLGFPLVPGEKADLWDVEARVSFVAQDKPVKISLFIPKSSRRFAVVDENFISRGYGLTTSLEDSNRRAVWSIRKDSGAQALYYRAVIQALESTEQEPTLSKPEIDPSLAFEGSALTAAEAILALSREQSADLDTLVAQLLKRLANPGTDSNVALLVGSSGDQVKRIVTAIRVLNLAQIPARLVRGIRLEQESRKAEMQPWLQVFADGKWRYYDPATGVSGMPEDFLVFWRGSEPLLGVKGADSADFTASVRRTEAEGLEAATARGRAMNPHLVEFSLLSLPIKTQAVYQILLAVPVGALLLVIMRNVVGVNTFGTFMPVLIGLAFRETQLLWGIVLFSAVVSLGLAVRFYFERLKLLLVPRLAAVLTVVVLLMAILSILSHRIGLERGLSVALFPMVIMTMTIERMSIVWEERGPGEAMQQGLGSLMVAALTYLVMSAKYTEHLMFVFPELLLAILGASLLLGRYTGYRLVELRRFKALAPPRS